MSNLLVVDNPQDWPINLPGVEVVSGRAYLTDPAYSQLRATRVFNLCRSYRYQTIGYYVSLLAGARGHKPVPSISTVQDMKSQTIIRMVSDDLDQLIQQSFSHIQSKEFTLSIYFGRNVACRYDRLSLHLFNLIPVPLQRAQFVHTASKWQLQAIRPISASDIPEDHRGFVIDAAARHFAKPRLTAQKRRAMRHDLAILVNPAESPPPSNAKAIQRFIKAAAALGMRAELIEKDDYGRLAEFDALFIRETTAVNHHTYRFAARAAAEGMVVVDDPTSILKCTNKVYLAELLQHHEVRSPRTLIVHRDNVDAVTEKVGLPCILKQPDSSFSMGVVKADSLEDLRSKAARLLERSDLVIAQEFVPTAFDWRVGVFDRQPLFVAKYHMAKNHWQIIKRDDSGERHYGRVEVVPVELAPRNVVRTAVRAANLIGDGLYGIDIKQSGKDVYVIEINDNPNIDAGFEDALQKDQLYTRIMEVFLRRIERRREGNFRP